jgi:lytic murein transglycosylase
MKPYTGILAALACAFTLSAAQAACDDGEGFVQWLKAFKQEALAAGISKATWSDAAPSLEYDPGIVAKDRKQNVFSQSFLEFQGRMVSDYRIKQGKALIKKFGATLAEIEERFGVPAPVIVAFWGLETDFGANTGDLPILASLATLAYDCRRPEKFRPQLMAALDLIEKGDLTVDEMVGAWAGEIGQTQFLPADYDEKAVDFDGDGRRDLRNSVPDVLASTANFLRVEGWQAGQPWLQEVRVPDELPWENADLAIDLPRAQWAEWGVTAANGKRIPADDVPVSLLLPMGRRGPAFLAYANFKIYIKWNESLVYSNTAAYYATRLKGAPPVSPGDAVAFTYKQMIELQTLLAERGYDVGKIDGKLGAGTRAAVKDVQLKLGEPADSYPTAALLDRLRGTATLSGG